MLVHELRVVSFFFDGWPVHRSGTWWLMICVTSYAGREGGPTPFMTRRLWLPWLFCAPLAGCDSPGASRLSRYFANTPIEIPPEALGPAIGYDAPRRGRDASRSLISRGVVGHVILSVGSSHRIPLWASST